MKTWLEGYEPRYDDSLHHYQVVESPALKPYISAINEIVQKTKDKGVLKNCAEYLAVMEKWICISSPYIALYIDVEDIQKFISAIIKIAKSEAIKEKDTLNNCLKSLSSIEFNVSDIMNRGPKPYGESVCMHNYLLAIKTIFEKIENNQDALYIFASGLGRQGCDILRIDNKFKSDIKDYILLIKAIVEKIEVKQKSNEDFQIYNDALEQCLKFSGNIFSEVNRLQPECIKDCVLTIYNIMVEKNMKLELLIQNY